MEKLRAIISVSDKRGIVDLARAIAESGGEIYSTGGTARALVAAGLSVIEIADFTGFPEILDGRVKTLHPRIFGGILGRPDREEDRQAMEAHVMLPFQIVCVNLYPFRETISRPDVALEEAVENIDIGGLSLIRAAAKNHEHVAVLTSPDQYPAAIDELKQTGKISLDMRRRLMVDAFRHTAAYDAVIASFFARQWDASQTPGLPQEMTINWTLAQTLRHGENSHQLGGVYSEAGQCGLTLVSAKQLNGKQLSYNNFLDMDAALAIVRLQQQPACSVIKHNNPCGAAIGSTLPVACQKAFAGDPVSAFGSVVAFNREVDAATAQWLAETAGLFVEVIVAPGFEEAALELLKTKPKWKANVRLMSVGNLLRPSSRWEIRSIAGGALIQESDQRPDDRLAWKTVTEATVPADLMDELAFGWDIVRFVKSNAITLSRDLSLVGVGAGQMSRVDSVRIAIEKAGERARGAVLASDAFFPFADSIPLAAAAGVAGIIQPGGSVKDAEVIAAANEFQIPMVFTGRRQFKH